MVPVEPAAEFKAKYGIFSIDKGFSIANTALLGGQKSVIFIAQMLDIREDGTIRFLLSNTNLVDELIDKYNLPGVKEDIHKMIRLSALLSPSEVQSYFESRNPKWRKAIELIDGNRLRSFTLLPVGAYIGSRHLFMLSGREIELETFYK